MVSVSGMTCDAGELGRLHLFKSTNLNSLQGLLQQCPVQELACGEVLLTSGQPNYTLYLLLSGRLQVYLDEPGTEPFIALEGGESVGEMSVIDNQLTSATVVADTSCRLLAVGEDVLWALVDRSPIVARNLLHALTQRMRHSNTVIRKNRQLQCTYERHAVTDPLTGLYNRRWLDEMLPRQMRGCADSGRPFALFIADIDFFKEFNDTHGHLAGDRAIQCIAKSIQDNLRKSDLAVRFGGEEFLVLLPGYNIEGARMIAERVRNAVKDTVVAHTDGRTLPSITVSIGLSEMAPDHTPEMLMEAADTALYRAKKNGRDSVMA
jgi:diguanylate cyclase (GGDEF)-like protein